MKTDLILVLLLACAECVHSFASFKLLPPAKREWLYSISVKQGYVFT